MGIIDKAKELTGQAAEMAGDLGGDDLIMNAIIRAVDKQKRVNKILKEKGCNYRVSRIDVEVGIPAKVVFGVAPESE